MINVVCNTGYQSHYQMINPSSATYNLQQTTISNFAAILKLSNKAYFMRIVCWQTILMKYHTLQSLSSAAVVIDTLRVKQTALVVNGGKMNKSAFIQQMVFITVALYQPSWWLKRYIHHRHIVSTIMVKTVYSSHSHCINYGC